MFYTVKISMQKRKDNSNVVPMFPQGENMVARLAA